MKIPHANFFLALPVSLAMFYYMNFGHKSEVFLSVQTAYWLRGEILFILLILLFTSLDNLYFKIFSLLEKGFSLL